MTPPSIRDYQESASGWSISRSSIPTASLTWQAGDVITTLAGAEDAAGGAPSIPTGPAGFVNTVTGTATFSAVDVNAAASSSNCRSAYAIAGSNGSGVITCTLSSARISGLSAWSWANASGIGDHKEQHTATKSVGSTRVGTGEGSGYVWCCLDFNGDGIGSPSPTPSNTRESLATTSDFLVADLVNVTINQNYGEGTGSGGTIGPFSLLVIEVLPLLTIPVIEPDVSKFPKFLLRR
jgi:hypothetical protein